MPVLSAADMHRAYELYGVHPEYVCGKMMKKKASRAVMDNNLILDEKKQTLYTDVMHIDGSKILVTVCEPLQLTLQFVFYTDRSTYGSTECIPCTDYTVSGSHD